MGWFGNGLYDGDETFTTQLDFIRKAGLKKEVELYENSRRIILLSEHRHIIEKALLKLIKSLGKNPSIGSDAYKWEYWSIKTHMLADLIINNKLKMSKEFKQQALTALEFLKGDNHAGEFNNPAARRKVLKRLEDKIKAYKTKKA